jgi:azurin
MQRRNALRLIAGTAFCVASPAWAAPAVLRISSDGDFLAFTPDELTCRSGAQVRVIFQHTGKRIQQLHNWVLLKPGTDEAFLEAALTSDESPKWNPPKDPRVLAATKLCGPGHKAMVEFTAPAPGDYPFICSFAGHGAEMRGVLHVLA